MPNSNEGFPRRLVVCLDGTWNSSFSEKKRRDKDERGERTILKPTNTLKTCRAVRPRAADGRMQICYYDIGVGALADYPGAANRLLYTFDRLLGGVWGAGYEGNVEDALHFLAVNYEKGNENRDPDEIFIFGFSRGAAEARAVTQFLDWSGGLPEKDDAYYLPILFRAYVKGHGDTNERVKAFDVINANRAKEHPPRGPLNLQPVRVRYLGVWDTVLALGSRFKKETYSITGGHRSFYTGATPAACVNRARQALAVDEHRYDFRPEVWEGCLPNQKMEQRWFCGVHSNVGGGYGRDALANLTLRWILEGAHEEKLDLKDDYLAYFFDDGRCGSFGSLYNSSTLGFRIGDAIRRADGRRKLVGLPEGTKAEIDPSVFERMNRSETDLRNGADAGAITTPYRPENVIEFLAAHPNWRNYLRDMGAPMVPADVEARLPP
jgi:uncharacterized protein (DUF2235 family)